MTNDYGYVRVAAATPHLRIADPQWNAIEHVGLARIAAAKHVQVLLFPELSLTGYTCKDLFANQDLLNAALTALDAFLVETKMLQVLSVVGMPLRVDGSLYNVAVCCYEGKILAIIPKSFIPTYKEFEEDRWFAPAHRARRDSVRLNDQIVPFGTDIVLEAEAVPHLLIGIEICEDLWLTLKPSSHLALQGATLLLNLSASNELVAKDEYRRQLVTGQSSNCFAAYMYTSSGVNESTADVVFGGHRLIAENGSLLAECSDLDDDPPPPLVVTDVDLGRMLLERQRTGSFGQNASRETTRYRRVLFGIPPLDLTPANLHRSVDPYPFVPRDSATRDVRCKKIFAIAVAGLCRRLQYVFETTGSKKSVIGVSGGLDSTNALLIACRAYDKLGWSRSLITAVTMPGFGTTDRTYRNAVALCKAIGVTFREIPIRDATMQHLRDIGHKTAAEETICSGECFTCQNSQARIRTLILMDLGFVIGTGDLSEIALGWCTFNGDHMSMYNVNCGIPKTLIRFVVGWVADRDLFGGEVTAILRDVLATPISPELSLPKNDGTIAQVTEDIIGPYVLHDFFLWHFVRNGFEVRKLLMLADVAFGNVARTPCFSREEIAKWLDKFYTRFISAQYKRNAAPDGPKVGSVSLSQRGDWRMPSDATVTLWRTTLRAIVEDNGFVA